MKLFLDDTNRLRTVWRLLLFLFSFMAAQIAVSLMLLIVYAAALVAMHGNFDPEELRLALQRISLDPSGEWMLVNIDYTTRGSVLLVVVFRLWLDRRSLGSLGLTAPALLSGERWSWRRSRPVAFALGAAPIAIGFLIVWLCGGFEVQDFALQPEAAVFTAALVIAAFHEEIICRGYLLQNMVDVGRPVTGVFVSSAIFWVLHGLNPSAWSSWWVSANLFLAGVLLALAYLVSRDLWFPTVLHFAWNFTQGIVLDINVSGLDTPGAIALATDPASPGWLTGGEFGLEGSAVTTGIMVLMVCALAFALRRRSLSG